MPAMACPNLSGTGSTQDAAGADGVWPMGDGTGTLIDDDDVDPG